MDTPKNFSSRARLLARSLFVLCVVMLLVGLVGLPFILGGDAPQAISYVLILGGIFAVSVAIFRQDEADLINRVETSLKPPRLGILDLILAFGMFGLGLFGLYWLFEGDQTALGGVAIIWCALWLLLLGAMYRDFLRVIARPIQAVLISIGVVIVALIALEGLLRLYAEISPNETEADIDLVEFQPEIWNTITDTPLEWAEQYWSEYQLARREIVWTPYVYWRMRPFEGEYVNVNDEGIRYTPPPEGEPEMTIHVYGGSTVWGHGSRDTHTIPSELVRAMGEQNIAAEVVNMGEVGYISRQDATLFDTQLAIGNAPDMAVFYWGFNDANITVSDGYIGVSGAEKNRGAQFEGAQCVVDLSTPTLFNSLLYKTEIGTRLLEQLDILPVNPAEGCALGTADWSNVNVDLVALQTTNPEAFAANIQHMTRYVEGLADDYGVHVIFIWQPSLHLKDPLSYYERQIVERSSLDEWWAYYDELDTAVREIFTDDDNFLLWSDFEWGSDETVNIFIDRVHITEEGNAIVADAIAEYLASSPLTLGE